MTVLLRDATHDGASASLLALQGTIAIQDTYISYNIRSNRQRYTNTTY